MRRAQARPCRKSSNDVFSLKTLAEDASAYARQFLQYRFTICEHKHNQSICTHTRHYAQATYTQACTLIVENANVVRTF